MREGAGREKKGEREKEKEGEGRDITPMSKDLQVANKGAMFLEQQCSNYSGAVLLCQVIVISGYSLDGYPSILNKESSPL